MSRFCRSSINRQHVERRTDQSLSGHVGPYLCPLSSPARSHWRRCSSGRSLSLMLVVRSGSFELVSRAGSQSLGACGFSGWWPLLGERREVYFCSGVSHAGWLSRYSHAPARWFMYGRCAEVGGSYESSLTLNSSPLRHQKAVQAPGVCSHFGSASRGL